MWRWNCRYMGWKNTPRRSGRSMFADYPRRRRFRCDWMWSGHLQSLRQFRFNGTGKRGACCWHIACALQSKQPIVLPRLPKVQCYGTSRLSLLPKPSHLRICQTLWPCHPDERSRHGTLHRQADSRTCRPSAPLRSAQRQRGRTSTSWCDGKRWHLLLRRRCKRWWRCQNRCRTGKSATDNGQFWRRSHPAWDRPFRTQTSHICCAAITEQRHRSRTGWNRWTYCRWADCCLCRKASSVNAWPHKGW